MTGRGQGASAFVVSGTSASALTVAVPRPWGAALSRHTLCCMQERLLLTGLLFPSPITPSCVGVFALELPGEAKQVVPR